MLTASHEKGFAETSRAENILTFLKKGFGRKSQMNNQRGLESEVQFFSDYTVFSIFLLFFLYLRYLLFCKRFDKGYRISTHTL